MCGRTTIATNRVHVHLHPGEEGLGGAACQRVGQRLSGRSDHGKRALLRSLPQSRQPSHGFVFAHTGGDFSPSADLAARGKALKLA